MSLDLDETDKLFVDELTPEGCMATGLMVIVTFIDPDGTPRWRPYCQMGDAPLSTWIGLLELAKHYFMADADVGDEDE